MTPDPVWLPVVQVSERALEVISGTTRRAYPEEGCGFLIGPEPGQVTEAWTAINQHEGDKGSRFMIDPAHLIVVQRKLEKGDDDLVGFFHSHPGGPPEPSETDLENAWPGYLYLIQDGRDGDPGEVRGWRLREDRSGFDPVEIEEAPG